MGYWDYFWGTLRDYHRDPFPHSLLRTRELGVEGVKGGGVLGISGLKLEGLACVRAAGWGVRFKDLRLYWVLC